MEDGREIFDDDLDDDSLIYNSKKKEGKKKRKSDRFNEDGHSKSNIKNMLMNMPTKKKKEVSL